MWIFILNGDKSSGWAESVWETDGVKASAPVSGKHEGLKTKWEWSKHLFSTTAFNGKQAASTTGSGFFWEQEMSLGTKRGLLFVMAVTLKRHFLLKLYSNYPDSFDLSLKEKNLWQCWGKLRPQLLWPCVFQKGHLDIWEQSKWMPTQVSHLCKQKLCVDCGLKKKDGRNIFSIEGRECSAFHTKYIVYTRKNLKHRTLQWKVLICEELIKKNTKKRYRENTLKTICTSQRTSI